MSGVASQSVLSQIAAWGNFYVITGSSAAALTGLQFVVIALVSELNRVGTMAEVRAFGTPTIVHFCGVLLISALMSAPWTAFSQTSIGLGACGAAGVVYAAVIVQRTRRQTNYKPVFEDWLWHCAFPFIAYFALLVAALLLTVYPAASLFISGGTVILLLFVGIHNAWDTVTYILVEQRDTYNTRNTGQPPAE